MSLDWKNMEGGDTAFKIHNKLRELAIYITKSYTIFSTLKNFQKKGDIGIYINDL